MNSELLNNELLGIFRRGLQLFYFSTLSSSRVKCLRLISSGPLMIFVIGLSVTLGEFPSRLLKCSFRMCFRSSWLAAFSFAPEALFVFLTSFTVSHAIRDCLSFTEFLILLI